MDPSEPAEPPPIAPPADSGWQTLEPGLEQRHLFVAPDAANPQIQEELFILRLEPDRFALRLAYDPRGRLVSAWLDDEDALGALNAGFFRAEETALIPTGLTILDGEAMGESYVDFGGMLTITDGYAQLRWLADQPWGGEETVDDAFQSFPLLVRPGGELGFPAEEEDLQIARRSVIAQDRSGRLLLLLAPRGLFTLHQLSAWLSTSDLDLDIALNLDGGPSSGLLLRGASWGSDSLDRIPLVILLERRGE